MSFRLAPFPKWRAFSAGYAIDYQKKKGASPHVFCGEQAIPGAVCPAGNHPLLRFLTLDTRDERLGLARLGVPLVHLLHCWKCELSELDYRLETTGVSLLQEDAEELEPELEAMVKEFEEDMKRADAEYLLKGDPEIGDDPLDLADGDLAVEEFPYANYPVAFPQRTAVLVPLDDKTQAAFVADATKKRNPKPKPPPHQVGGLPRLVQRVASMPKCGGCKKAMPFLAAIGDDCADARGFTGNAYAQVLYFLCEPCRRVHSFNVCD